LRISREAKIGLPFRKCYDTMDNPIQLNKILLFQTDEGKVNVDVYFVDENFWMTQKTMGDLFEVKTPAILKHLKNIYESGELERESTVSILETVQNEGGREISRQIEYYNLDAIIAIGYRINTKKATQFRIWATISHHLNIMHKTGRLKRPVLIINR